MSCRFIPSRQGMQNGQSVQNFMISPSTPYDKGLSDALLPGRAKTILCFQAEPKKMAPAPAPAAKELRLRSQILVPDLQEDFYTNNLKWSSKNVIAVAGANTIWLDKDGKTLSPLPAKSEDETYIKCIEWSPNGQDLYWGTEDSRLLSFDGAALRLKVRTQVDDSRVQCLDFRTPNELTVSTKRGSIYHADFRMKKMAWKKKTGSNVCRVQWSRCGQYFATGDDDNAVRLFDSARPDQVVNEYSHKGAIKALQIQSPPPPPSRQRRRNSGWKFEIL